MAESAHLSNFCPPLLRAPHTPGPFLPLPLPPRHTLPLFLIIPPPPPYSVQEAPSHCHHFGAQAPV